jgi:hypothetical protein
MGHGQVTRIVGIGVGIAGNYIYHLCPLTEHRDMIDSVSPSFFFSLFFFQAHQVIEAPAASNIVSAKFQHLDYRESMMVYRRYFIHPLPFV